jgi:hypothetical protein
MKYLIFLLFLLGVSQQGISQNVQDYYAYIQGLEGSGQSVQQPISKGCIKILLRPFIWKRTILNFMGIQILSD